MRTETYTFSQRQIVSAVAGVITRMAPLCLPRNLQPIVYTISHNIMSKGIFNGDSFVIAVNDIDSLKNWVHDELYSMSQFVNLNLSENEIENCITVDDDRREKFSFTDGYHSFRCAEDYKESSKNDFIDLDACVSNITREIWSSVYDNHECFLCDHSTKNNENPICITCTLNPKYKDNYHYTTSPFGDDVPRWCTHGCAYGRAICCCDCDKRHECAHVCTEPCVGEYTGDRYECPVECKNMIYRKGAVNEG